MRMSISEWSSQGPCLIPTLSQPCGGQLRMWWVSVSKPSREGSSQAAHTVLSTPTPAPCRTSPRTKPPSGSKHTLPPSAPQGKGLVWKKKCAKRQIWVQDPGPGGVWGSAAAWRAGSASCSTRAGDGSCRYVQGRTSTEGCVVLSAGKGKGKAWESCKPGWEKNFFLDVILFLVL